MEQAHAYYVARWSEDMHAVPRFLWNAKMRFGKTFAAYQLAKRMGAKAGTGPDLQARGEDAWRTDIESHVDFDGWKIPVPQLGGQSNPDRRQKKPVVYFGSFQDLWEDKFGNIQGQRTRGFTKQDGTSLSLTNSHFGAWRKTAKELFEVMRRASEREEKLLEDTKRLTDRVAGSARAFGGRNRVPADHDAGLPLSVWHPVQGAGHGRVH